MLINLALQNIKEKKVRTFIAILSIAIGTASLVIFLGLSNGIKQASFTEIEKRSPLTQITVRPKLEETAVLSFIAKSEENKFTEETVNEIAKIDGIKSIYREIQFNNFASLEIKLLGLSLITDSMIFGLPYEFIQEDISSTNTNIWESSQEPYPALIPRKLLDLYNLTMASSQNLPKISEENLIGKELIIYPNYSTFFPIYNDKTDQVKIEVVGFSDKINLIGVTLPYDIVEKLNLEYTGKTTNTFLELFVETEDASETIEIAQKIENLGYSTEYFQKNLEDVEAKFKYLNNSLGIISGIILLTAALSIVSTFLSTVSERAKEIGLFRALGATRKHIKKIILIEATFIGLLGSILGVMISQILNKVIDKLTIENFSINTFQPETIFLIDTNLIIFAIFFGCLLSIISAYIPAQKASKINPIEALNRI